MLPWSGNSKEYVPDRKSRENGRRQKQSSDGTGHAGLAGPMARTAIRTWAFALNGMGALGRLCIKEWHGLTFV